MTKNKKILIAKIIAPFGVKGEVKILSFCKNSSDFKNYQCFFKDGSQVKIEIKRKSGFTKTNDEILIAKIDEINNRNDFEKFRNKEIFVNRDEFKELKKDEFYQTDLIGMDVIFENKKIGKVINILDFGASEIIEIEFLEENKERNLLKIETFPFNNDFFGEIDVEKNFIEIKLPQILLLNE